MVKVSASSYAVVVLLFSFWLSIFPAYLYFSTLEASDINSVTSFEYLDEEDSTPNLDNDNKVVRSIFLIKPMFMDFSFLTRVPNLFFQLQTSTAKPSILRC